LTVSSFLFFFFLVLFLTLFARLVIRANLLWGKLSQTTQSLYVVRSSVRTFEKEEWETLEKRILAWKTGLSSVLDVVNNAKRMVHVPQVPVA
jgi:translation initiation factor 3 subunit M